MAWSAWQKLLMIHVLAEKRYIKTHEFISKLLIVDEKLRHDVAHQSPFLKNLDAFMY